MTFLYKILVCFFGITLSLILVNDYSGIEFGKVAEIMGYIGIIGFPIWLINEGIKK